MLLNFLLNTCKIFSIESHLKSNLNLSAGKDKLFEDANPIPKRRFVYKGSDTEVHKKYELPASDFQSETIVLE